MDSQFIIAAVVRRDNNDSQKKPALTRVQWLALALFLWFVTFVFDLLTPNKCVSGSWSICTSSLAILVALIFEILCGITDRPKEVKHSSPVTAISLGNVTTTTTGVKYLWWLTFHFSVFVWCIWQWARSVSTAVDNMDYWPFWTTYSDWKERLWKDQFCVERKVNLNSVNRANFEDSFECICDVTWWPLENQLLFYPAKMEALLFGIRTLGKMLLQQMAPNVVGTVVPFRDTVKTVWRITKVLHSCSYRACAPAQTLIVAKLISTSGLTTSIHCCMAHQSAVSTELID